MCLGCFGNMFRMLLEHFWNVLGCFFMFLGCVRDVFGMFLECFWDVFGMFGDSFWDDFGIPFYSPGPSNIISGFTSQHNLSKA